MHLAPAWLAAAAAAGGAAARPPATGAADPCGARLPRPPSPARPPAGPAPGPNHGTTGGAVAGAAAASAAKRGAAGAVGGAGGAAPGAARARKSAHVASLNTPSRRHSAASFATWACARAAAQCVPRHPGLR